MPSLVRFLTRCRQKKFVRFAQHFLHVVLILGIGNTSTNIQWINKFGYNVKKYNVDELGFRWEKN